MGLCQAKRMSAYAPGTSDRGSSLVRPYDNTESPSVSPSLKVQGVRDMDGNGAVEASRVKCWAAAVWPARMDMDRFGVCVVPGDRTIVAGGIFDGHGIAGSESWGRAVAERAAKQVVRGAVEWRLGRKPSLSSVFRAFQDRHEKAYDDQIAAEVDRARDEFEKAQGYSAGPRTLPAEGGTTATVVVVDGDELTAAWVGDSRAVLASFCDGGKVEGTALTDDHNVSSSQVERERCEAAGGMILGNFVGAPNADGMLQVTRSLGDRAHHDIVSAEPELRTHTISKRDYFVLIASDGIWEVLPQDTIISIVADALRHKKNSPNAASDAITELRATAQDAIIRYGRKCDDCSAVLLVFGDDRPRSSDDAPAPAADQVC